MIDAFIPGVAVVGLALNTTLAAQTPADPNKARKAAKAESVTGARHGFSGGGIAPDVSEINRRTLAFFVAHLTAAAVGVE